MHKNDTIDDNGGRRETEEIHKGGDGVRDKSEQEDNGEPGRGGAGDWTGEYEDNYEGASLIIIVFTIRNAHLGSRKFFRTDYIIIIP